MVFARLAEPVAEGWGLLVAVAVPPDDHVPVQHQPEEYGYPASRIALAEDQAP